MFLKDFQNKKDELSSISYLKKHAFIIGIYNINNWIFLSFQR